MSSWLEICFYYIKMRNDKRIEESQIFSTVQNILTIELINII